MAKQINIPDLKTPSGTIYNDAVTFIVALVALLHSLGVIG